MDMKNYKGFTLIELLVVVAIIWILAAVGVVAYNGYTESAKNAVLKANHKTIVKYVSTIFTRCDIDGGTIPIQTYGSINCNTVQHHGAITAMNLIFAKYFANLFGKNPYDNSKEMVLVSGQKQPAGTINFDYGRPEQCDNVRMCVSINLATSKERISNKIYMSHW